MKMLLRFTARVSLVYHPPFPVDQRPLVSVFVITIVTCGAKILGRGYPPLNELQAH